MAQKRMFDKDLIDSDKFLDMPLSTQCLYFHLNMRADDEGFISNPKRIMKMININDDDLKILISKEFIIPFESGVIVIKHWKINNYLSSTRVKPSLNHSERNELEITENGEYSRCLTNVKPMFNRCLTSIEEKSIEEKSIEEIPSIKIDYNFFVDELKSIFKKHYSNISIRFNSKKVKDKLKIKLKKYDFEVIKNGFANYIEYQKKCDTEITFVKSAHIFINDDMFNDFQEEIPFVKQVIKNSTNVIGQDEVWYQQNDEEDLSQDAIDDIKRKLKGE